MFPNYFFIFKNNLKLTQLIKEYKTMGQASSKDNANIDNVLTLYDLELIRICWDSVKDKDDLGKYNLFLCS